MNRVSLKELTVQFNSNIFLALFLHSLFPSACASDVEHKGLRLCSLTKPSALLSMGYILNIKNRLIVSWYGILQNQWSQGLELIG